MRKNKRIVCAAAFLLILISSFNFVAYASSATCAEDNFSKLYGYVEVEENVYNTVGNYAPPNSIGSCGYVAISMLLAYYDAYWHKDMVPDNLEWNPGVYDLAKDDLVSPFKELDEYIAWNTIDTVLRNKGLTDEQLEEERLNEFHEFIENNSDNYLQCHLLKIGLNKHNLFYSFKANRYGLNSNWAKGILEEYLYNERLFSNADISIHRETGSLEELRPIIATQINNGNPVLYFADNYEGINIFNNSSSDDKKGGHVMLAFGFDSSGDIRLHYGWNYYGEELDDKNIRTLSETEYKYQTSIVWLEIKDLPHVCDYNFVDSVDPGTTYCACQIYGSTHPAHGNNHLFVDRTDENHHWKGCNCGAKIDVQEHSFYYTSAFTSHTLKCYECDYFVNSAHTFEIVGNVSETYHEVECFCGYIKNEKHSKGYIVGDHDAYCDCGQYLGIEHTKGYCEENSSSNHNVYCNCGTLIGTEDHYVSGYQYNSLANHNKLCACGKIMGREVHTPVTKLGNTYCSGCLCNLSGSGPGLVNGGKDDPDSLIE